MGKRGADRSAGIIKASDILDGRGECELEFDEFNARVDASLAAQQCEENEGFEGFEDFEKDYSKVPITVTLEFRICAVQANEHHGAYTGLRYDGTAHPGVSSGSSFGAGTFEYRKGLIEEIIEKKTAEYQEKYARPVIVRHKVVDERAKQFSLTDYSAEVVADAGA
jgi:hypothetical protein